MRKNSRRSGSTVRGRFEQLVALGLDVVRSRGVRVHLAPPFIAFAACSIGGDDARVGAAAADVAVHAADDLVARRLGVLGQQRDRGHDHARRAVAALHARRRRGTPPGAGAASRRREALDGADRLARRRPPTRVLHDRTALAVDEDGAGAAPALAAAVLAAGQAEVVAQDAEQRARRRRRRRAARRR